MEPIVNQIHTILIKKRKTIAVAESCTGGLVSTLMTQRSGSSRYFIMGVVSYSNDSKRTLLKIPLSSLKQYGAVSKATARSMAHSIRRIAKTDFGIGITGIAGPTGAVPGKPVGTVFIAVTSVRYTHCQKFQFRGNRTAIRKQAALRALSLLKQLIAGNPES